jgi:hypothetical protein
MVYCMFGFMQEGKTMRNNKKILVEHEKVIREFLIKYGRMSEYKRIMSDCSQINLR